MWLALYTGALGMEWSDTDNSCYRNRRYVSDFLSQDATIDDFIVFNEGHFVYFLLFIFLIESKRKIRAIL